MNSIQRLQRCFSNPYVNLGLGVFFLSFSPIFTHWADASGVVTSFYRMLIAFLLLLPFSSKIFNLKETDQRKRLTWKQIKFPMIAGVFSGIDYALWGTAIKETSVANATLLNYISPLWVSLVAILVLKERYKKSYWMGLLLALFGSVTVLNILNIHLGFNLKGEGFAILSSFFYAGYFLLTQKGRTHLSTFQQLFVWLLVCCLTLGTIMVGFRLPFFGYSPTTYLIFILSAVVSQLLGYICLTYALGKIPASIVSPTLSLQPLMTALLAIPFAHQDLSAHQIIGGLFVLSGIYLINKSEIKA